MSDTIERLDFTGPPPGLRCDPLGWSGEVPEFRESAWVQYMAGNDPPGMWSRVGAFGMFNDLRYPLPAFGCGCTCGSQSSWTAVEARFAAWAHYIRRVGLANAFRPAVHQGFAGIVPTWPMVLVWSDERVTAAEVCLIDEGPA